MFSDNDKNRACEFAEETLAYLYGEMASGEKTKFESHLARCAACSEDAAGFNAVRSSISEWRRLEFKHLNIPAITLPTFEMPEKRTVSRIEAMCAYFSVSPWITAAASLAILAVFAGLAAIFYNRGGDSSVAVNVNRNAAPTDTLSTGVHPKQAVSPPADVKQDEKPQTSVAVKTKTEKVLIENQRPAQKVSLPVKSAARAAQPNVSEAAKRSRSVKNAPRNAKQPTLAGSNDDEDTSLRLADIFEEISMR